MKVDGISFKVMFLSPMEWEEGMELVAQIKAIIESYYHPRREGASVYLDPITKSKACKMFISIPEDEKKRPAFEDIIGFLLDKKVDFQRIEITSINDELQDYVDNATLGKIEADEEHSSEYTYYLIL